MGDFGSQKSSRLRKLKVWTVNGFKQPFQGIRVVTTILLRTFNYFLLTVYKLHTMPYCTYSETARILGYSSRSTLYKVRKDGWLKQYEVSIDGRKYLDLYPRGLSPLDKYLKGILQWRPSNPIRKMKYVDD